jgi:hypothetical protein
MTPGELREAITQPAAALGVQINDELVSELLAAVGSVPDALPLLEFTLTELWSQQRARRIERVPSSEIVGNPASIIQGPLSRHADRVFEDLVREYGEAVFRNVMVGLVWIADPDSGGQDTRRVRKRSSFSPAEWQIIEQLASEYREARLITMRSDQGDGEATAEIAHEVLIRQWPRLQRWLNEDRAFRLWLQTTERDANRWRKSKEQDLLYRGGRLQEALRWQRDRAAPEIVSVANFIETAEQRDQAELEARQKAEREHVRALSDKVEAEERARVEAERRAGQERVAAAEATRLKIEAEAARQKSEQEKSRADSARHEAERERDKAQWILLGTLTVWFFLAIGITLLWVKWREADSFSKLALNNETRALAALSRLALADHRPMDSVVLGLAAWPRGKDNERPRLESVLSVISAALATVRLTLREFRHSGPVNGAALTNDEGRILSWSQDGTLRMWDVRTGQQIGPTMQHEAIGPFMRHEAGVNGAILTMNERRILSWSQDATLRQWDVATGQQIGPAMRHCCLTFPPDGGVRGATLTIDEGRILSWSQDGLLRQWDVATGQQIGPSMWHEPLDARPPPYDELLEPESSVVGVILAEDERRILSWSSDGTLRLWDVATGHEIGPAMRRGGSLSFAILTKDHGRFLSWSARNTLRLWDVASGQQIGSAMQHDSRIEQLQSSRGALLTKDERRVVSWSRLCENPLFHWFVSRICGRRGARVVCRGRGRGRFR